MSRTAIGLQTNASPSAGSALIPSVASAPEIQLKTFQFVQNPRLMIDHCSISQMSVVLESSGKWILSLRADQNPLPTEDLTILNPTTGEPRQLFTEHLNRNQFFVQVRCYVSDSLGEQSRLVGKAMVIPLKVEPFWVQKERPYALFETGFSRNIAKYFQVVDHVEIEFYYAREQ